LALDYVLRPAWTLSSNNLGHGLSFTFNLEETQAYTRLERIVDLTDRGGRANRKIFNDDDELERFVIRSVFHGCILSDEPHIYDEEDFLIGPVSSDLEALLSIKSLNRQIWPAAIFEELNCSDFRCMMTIALRLRRYRN
jgi:hypothetical protein